MSMIIMDTVRHMDGLRQSQSVRRRLSRSHRHEYTRTHANKQYWLPQYERSLDDFYMWMSGGTLKDKLREFAIRYQSGRADGESELFLNEMHDAIINFFIPGFPVMTGTARGWSMMNRSHILRQNTQTLIKELKAKGYKVPNSNRLEWAIRRLPNFCFVYKGKAGDTWYVGELTGGPNMRTAFVHDDVEATTPLATALQFLVLHTRNLGEKDG